MMLIRLLKSYGIWLAISILVCLLGIVLTAYTEPHLTRDFVLSYIYHWNGLLVAMTGFGALHFALSTHRSKFHHLTFEILTMSDHVRVLLTYELEVLFSFRRKNFIAVPVLILGSVALYICGYPLEGAPKVYFFAVTSMMFYAGGLILAYCVSYIRVFSIIESHSDAIDLKENVNIVELEDFTLYISILFLVEIVGLYFGFRGTLTANFTFKPPSEWIENVVGLLSAPGSDYSVVRNLLIFPIVIFLPTALFFAVYIKYVLRKIYLSSVKRRISEIDALVQPALDALDESDGAEKIFALRKSALEIKEKIISNNRVIPLITIKDSPAIAIAIIVLIQFIWINDDTVKEFFSYTFGSTN